MKYIISLPPSSVVAITNTFHHGFSRTATFPSLPPLTQLFHSFTGDIRITGSRSNAIYKSDNKGVLKHATAEDYLDIIHSTPASNSQEILDPKNDINEYIKAIKTAFDSMEDGVVTPSAYDTAWVALIKDVNGPGGGPQFPSSLQWVVNHQLRDGSWGDPLMFSASDRIINTLACVIALRFWNMHPDKCKKGLEFVDKNLNKLKEEKDEHQTCGFEIVFPMLIELARKLEIKLSVDSLVLKEVYAKRDRKLAKIPKDMLHETPTTLLYSLEGMKDLEWEKLLKLLCTNGSFICSPAPTAFAFMQTKDQKCLAFLTNLVAEFNGGVPHTYPVDFFEHIWVVDRLQRLGIARYFHTEIKNCVKYIYRNWNQTGIGSARNINIPDVDDTAMGFRILRMHGYQVSTDAFRQFMEDGKFVCYAGQLSESVTAMFDLYRASQMLFPGEKILEDANKFTHKFLTDKRSRNELVDKWVISKDLPGEVGYALDVPWYASLPRLEARYYLEQYGGDDDAWIGKSLYRMGNVNNNKHLEMAKLDYNHCQTIHQMEWRHMQKWYVLLNMEGSSYTKLLWSYYEAAASIFEPERYNERLAWAKTTVLLETITSIFTKSQSSNVDMQAFVDEFINAQQHDKNQKPWHTVMDAVHETLNQISADVLTAHGVDIYPHLLYMWRTWLLSSQKGLDVAQGEAELIVQTISLCSGRWLTEKPLSHPQYQRLSLVTNNICHQLAHKENCIISSETESNMQELVQLVYGHSPNDIDPDLKQTFLTVAKTYYYRAHFDHETINGHIDKVLFENVI